MTGFPGSDWDGGGGPAPLQADWRRLGQVRHTFTHFHLVLDVEFATLHQMIPPLRGVWVSALSPDALPTLMRKAHDLAANSDV